jgi:uncharacterized RDD family membrane protein YckC
MQLLEVQAPVPASVFRRFAAFCYDLLLLAALLFCFTLLVLLLRGGQEIPPGTIWFELCLVALAAVFFCGFWLHGGQTLGMRAWRIRVVADSTALTWQRALARFAAAAVSLLPAGLGLWWSLFDGERRSWHDRWTRTRVVRVDLPTNGPEAAPRS